MRAAYNLKIMQEVSVLKDDWRSVTSVAGQMKDVVDRVRAQCENAGAGEEPLPDGLQEPLEELERHVIVFCSTSLSLRH